MKSITATLLMHEKTSLTETSLTETSPEGMVNKKNISNSVHYKYLLHNL